MVGRIAILPEHANIARWHVVALLLPLCLAANGLFTGSIAALVLADGAWLGDRSRREAASGATPQITS